MVKYPVEELSEDSDDGTMPQNVAELSQAVVGHRITGVRGNVITLDNGTEVELIDSGDCCAYTELHSFLLYPDKVDHIITGVGTTDGYTTWHIYADLGDVLELSLSWSPGNPFYYGYGFTIKVDTATDR